MRGNGKDKDPETKEALVNAEVLPTAGSASPALEGPPAPDTSVDETVQAERTPTSREDFEAVCRERDEIKDQLLRKRADFANFKKRVEREKQQAGVEAVAAFLAGLLPTMDNLERALEIGGSEVSLREGMELTRRDLLAFLEAQGIQVLDPKGERFDPSRHQALAHEVVPGFEEGVVVEVYRKGYSFEGRLVRPALVKVAKGVVAEDPDPERVH